MRDLFAPSLKLVIFTVVTVLATGVLAATIANTDFSSTRSYSALFTSASDLQVGDDVRMRGVKIGQVSSLKVVNNSQALVGFQVDSSRSLSGQVSATVKYRNLIGQRYLALDNPPGAGPTLAEGATIPLTRTHPALNLTELFNGFQPLFQALSPKDVNQLSYEIIQIFQGEGGTVNQLLGSTASLTSTLADRDQVIGEVINNLNLVIGTVSARSPELSGLIDQLQQLVSGLNAQRQPIGSAISAIGDLTDTTAGLLHDARPSLKPDIAALRDVAGHLNDNSPLVEHVVQTLQPKLDTITRAVTYGSWYNFYVCDFTGTLKIESLGVNIPILPPPGAKPPARCGP
jgi:phospholipid/cholesterol/gamma-HCH transport system substrate-binding protein